jgi:hypothetical protein
MVETQSWIFFALLIVALSIAVCVGILWLVRKKIPAQVLKKNHDVAGFTLGIIGVLYSVILGFTVINTQNRYNEMLTTVQTEAILLADLYQDAGFFSEEERHAIRVSLRNYVDYVVKEEWWLSSERKIRLKTRELISAIWRSYYNIELTNDKMKIWYTESIAKLNNFMNARLARQFNSWEHLGDMMWSLLIVGAIMTTCFMFFFGLENLRMHMLMTALLAGYLSFMLFLVYSLDHVFKGPAAIKPVALEEVYSLFDQWDQITVDTKQ